MTDFQRAEHRAVAAALRRMDHDLLLRCACWFGGGTEIVLDCGEYRLSRDIDFLCADPDGYRELRTRAMRGGVAALFGPATREERGLRADQYGIRGIIGVDGFALRFEIVREARIGLDGRADGALGVPRLRHVDRIAEKLLANADRCQDRASACRDAVDLGMLALRHGAFAAEAWDKAETAYGTDVAHKLNWVLDHLSDPDARNGVAATLGMDPALLEQALAALARQAFARRLYVPKRRD